jgi:glycosyltransferase involved in cell wall biosynthesis
MLSCMPMQPRGTRLDPRSRPTREDFTPPEPPTISVIVPAYRQEATIRSSIADLSRALDSTGLSWEVIVVVDGDQATFREAMQCTSERVRVHGYERNRGKGFALRYGMTLSHGELVTFIDSDMQISPSEIGRMAKLLQLYEADMVVGSKRHPLSEVEYPPLRRLQSLAYQVLVRVLFRVKVRDTQTGLKMMRREVALRILDVALVKRFAFDLELLALAVHFNYKRIIEAPVVIGHSFTSTTNMAAVFWVLVDTAAIFYRLHLIRWYDRPEAHGLAALRASLPALSTLD